VAKGVCTPCHRLGLRGLSSTGIPTKGTFPYDSLWVLMGSKTPQYTHMCLWLSLACVGCGVAFRAPARLRREAPPCRREAAAGVQGREPRWGGGAKPPRGGGAEPPWGGGAKPPRGGGAEPPRGGGAEPPWGGGAKPPPGWRGGSPPRGYGGGSPRHHRKHRFPPYKEHVSSATEPQRKCFIFQSDPASRFSFLDG